VPVEHYARNQIKSNSGAKISCKRSADYIFLMWGVVITEQGEGLSHELMIQYARARLRLRKYPRSDTTHITSTVIRMNPHASSTLVWL
jgi:hypothetical protein